MSQVSGKIHFPAGTPAFSGATVTIVLEDVGMMDAPAPVITQQSLPNVSYSDGKTIEFAFNGVQPDENTSYNVRVHVSMNGNENIQQGDYITMQSYPVLTYGNPNNISIEVRRVG